MNRDELTSWLGTPSRTWRWNRGSVERYDGVEAKPDRLRWFRWSHELEDGGMTQELLQTVPAFRTSGPPPEMQAPASVVGALREWLDQHGDE